MEVVSSILQGMPSLLKNQQELEFHPQWPIFKDLPKLPPKLIFDNSEQPVNLLKLLPQRRRRTTKCKSCARRTYENSTLCRKCYLEKHGTLKRRCIHQQSKLYARGLCRQCYFTFYNHNLRLKK